MVDPNPDALANKLIEQIYDAQTERTSRLAITSLTNLFFEQLVDREKGWQSESTSNIVEGLLASAENRALSVILRTAALRSLRRMFDYLESNGRMQPLCESMIDRFRSLGRRRNDEAELTQMAREAANAMILKHSTSKGDTAVAQDTQFEVCPLFKAIQKNQDKLHQAHQVIATYVSEILANSAGFRPKTRDEGVEIATRINELAQRFGLRMASLEKPDEVVTLSFRKIGGTNPGAFVLRTTDSTRYAGVEVPKLRVLTP